MSHMNETVLTPCRRCHGDRRQANLRSFAYALFKSRRQVRRRENESSESYIDRYDAATFLFALLFMLLCIVDAYLTLLLIQHGSIELNPFLAWALSQHAQFFFLIKYVITGLCVVVTVMHRQFRMFGIRGIHFLLAGTVAYIILIEYQLSMLLPFWLN